MSNEVPVVNEESHKEEYRQKLDQWRQDFLLRAMDADWSPDDFSNIEKIADGTVNKGIESYTPEIGEWTPQIFERSILHRAKATGVKAYALVKALIDPTALVSASNEEVPTPTQETSTAPQEEVKTVDELFATEFSKYTDAPNGVLEKGEVVDLKTARGVEEWTFLGVEGDDAIFGQPHDGALRIHRQVLKDLTETEEATTDTAVETHTSKTVEPTEGIEAVAEVLPKSGEQERVEKRERTAPKRLIDHVRFAIANGEEIADKVLKSIAKDAKTQAERDAAQEILNTRAKITEETVVPTTPHAEETKTEQKEKYISTEERVLDAVKNYQQGYKLPSKELMVQYLGHKATAEFLSAHPEVQLESNIESSKTPEVVTQTQKITSTPRMGRIRISVVEGSDMRKTLQGIIRDPKNPKEKEEAEQLLREVKQSLREERRLDSDALSRMDGEGNMFPTTVAEKTEEESRREELMKYRERWISKTETEQEQFIKDCQALFPFGKQYAIKRTNGSIEHWTLAFINHDGNALVEDNGKVKEIPIEEFYELNMTVARGIAPEQVRSTFETREEAADRMDKEDAVLLAAQRAQGLDREMIKKQNLLQDERHNAEFVMGRPFRDLAEYEEWLANKHESEMDTPTEAVATEETLGDPSVQDEEKESTATASSQAEVAGIVVPEKISSSVLKKFGEKFGISESALAGIEGFSALSAGQQLLVLQNLEQIILEEVKKGAEEAQKEEWRKKSILGKILTAKWVGSYGFVRTKEIETELLKKAQGGVETDPARRKVLEGHMANMAALTNVAMEGPEVLVKADGTLEIQFVSPKYLFDSEVIAKAPENQEVLNVFNVAANAFAKIPREWGYAPRDEKSKEENAKYVVAKTAYERARYGVLGLYVTQMREHGEEKPEQAAMQAMNGIDERMQLSQLFNAHPDAEHALANIEDQNAIAEGLKDFWSDKGKYLAIGAGIRLGATLMAGVTGGAGLLLSTGVGGLVGTLQGKSEATKLVRDRRIDRRMSEEDEREEIAVVDPLTGGMKMKDGKIVTRAIKEYTDATFFTDRIERLSMKLEETTDETERELLESKIAKTTALMEQKFNGGLINWGGSSLEKDDARKGDTIANRLSFIQALGKGRVIESIDPMKLRAEMERITSSHQEKIEGVRKDEIILRAAQAGIKRAGFAFAGAFIAGEVKDLIAGSSWLGGKTSAVGQEIQSNDDMEKLEEFVAKNYNKDIPYSIANGVSLPQEPYTVVAGDNLTKILKANLPELKELTSFQQENVIQNLIARDGLKSMGIVDPDYIEVGQKIDLKKIAELIGQKEIRGEQLVEHAKSFTTSPTSIPQGVVEQPTNVLRGEAPTPSYGKVPPVNTSENLAQSGIIRAVISNVASIEGLSGVARAHVIAEKWASAAEVGVRGNSHWSEVRAITANNISAEPYRPMFEGTPGTTLAAHHEMHGLINKARAMGFRSTPKETSGAYLARIAKELSTPMTNEQLVLRGQGIWETVGAKITIRGYLRPLPSAETLLNKNILTGMEATNAGQEFLQAQRVLRLVQQNTGVIPARGESIGHYAERAIRIQLTKMPALHADELLKGKPAVLPLTQVPKVDVTPVLRAPKTGNLEA